MVVHPGADAETNDHYEVLGYKAWPYRIHCCTWQPEVRTLCTCTSDISMVVTNGGRKEWGKGLSRPSVGWLSAQIGDSQACERGRVCCEWEGGKGCTSELWSQRLPPWGLALRTRRQQPSRLYRYLNPHVTFTFFTGSFLVRRESTSQGYFLRTSFLAFHPSIPRLERARFGVPRYPPPHPPTPTSVPVS